MHKKIGETIRDPTHEYSMLQKYSIVTKIITHFKMS